MASHYIYTKSLGLGFGKTLVDGDNKESNTTHSKEEAAHD